MGKTDRDRCFAPYKKRIEQLFTEGALRERMKKLASPEEAPRVEVSPFATPIGSEREAQEREAFEEWCRRWLCVTPEHKRLGNDYSTLRFSTLWCAWRHAALRGVALESMLDRMEADGFSTTLYWSDESGDPYKYSCLADPWDECDKDNAGDFRVEGHGLTRADAVAECFAAIYGTGPSATSASCEGRETVASQASETPSIPNSDVVIPRKDWEKARGLLAIVAEHWKGNAKEAMEILGMSDVTAPQGGGE